MTIEELVKLYNYKKLPKELSTQQRQLYINSLPNFLNINGAMDDLYYNDILLCHGYKRIVIGDYGAYIEINPQSIVKENIKIKPGQEYRFLPKYKNIKYRWYCLKEDESCKIYYQINTVTYADYQPKMCYVSPNNISIKRK